MLGVEFPICAFSHCRDVVAAVTNAGGFGILGAAAHSPKRLESELTWIEEQTRGKPYGVDLLSPPKYVGAEQGGIDPVQARELVPEAHRAFVEELLARYGIAPSPEAGAERISRSGGGLNISPKGYEPLLDVAFSHDIRLIASALGPPPSDLVERAHKKEVLVAALAGTTQHARRHAAAGVDLIVAQGTEAGGHTGEVATMVLVPEVVNAVAPTPVLAAGGIAGGRQIAAALALGAEGVWCGSVWLTTGSQSPAVKDSWGGDLLGYRAFAVDDGQTGTDAAPPDRRMARPDTPNPMACRCRPLITDSQPESTRLPSNPEPRHGTGHLFRGSGCRFA